MIDPGAPMIEVPEFIVCVDCGQKAGRLTPPPEDGWEPGDLVAYRCSGCLDRWDLVVDEAGEAGTPDTEVAFDLRAFLEERRSRNREDAG